MSIQPSEDFHEQTLAHQGLVASEGFEVWQMQTNSSVYLNTLAYNRLGQPVAEEMRIGPNWAGREFQIRKSDREDNQRRMVDAAHDPFRNGMFVRRDAAQDADPNTASNDAVSQEDLFDICELAQADFEARVVTLGEIPVRRLLEVGEQMNISVGKVRFLEDYIRDTYAKGAAQKHLTGNGERLSV